MRNCPMRMNGQQLLKPPNVLKSFHRARSVAKLTRKLWKLCGKRLNATNLSSARSD